jgi:hypothetical protein
MTALSPVPPPPSGRTTGVSAWVEIVVPAADLAKQIADTEFVPKAMRDNPAVVTACILFGAEIGIGPMQSLAKIAIIDGRPAPSAELARALLLSDGHDIWVEEATTTKVTMAGKRSNSTHVQKVTWTMDDAKKAGLAGKPNWARYPRQMLLARASVELARMVAPDSLGGISVFAEELDDGPVNLTEDAVQEPPAQRKTTRRLAAAPTPPTETPPLPDEVPIGKIVDEIVTSAAEIRNVPLPPLPDDDLEAIREAEIEAAITEQPKDGPSDAQIRKLMVTYNGLGIRDRGAQKRLSAQLLDLTELASHNDLTKAEASRLIEMLVALDPSDIVRPDGVTPYILGSEPDGTA